MKVRESVVDEIEKLFAELDMDSSPFMERGEEMDMQTAGELLRYLNAEKARRERRRLRGEI